MVTLYLPKTRKILKPRTKRLVLNRRVWEAEGLVGVWPLGAYPDGRDLSLFGNHGDINSHPVHSGSGNRLGLDFDGSNDYVDVGNDDSLDVTAVITVGAWAKSPLTGIRYIAKKQYEGTPNWNGWNFGINYPSNGNVFATFNGGSSLSGGSGANDGNWHHVVFTKDSSNNEKLYLDGIVVDTATLPLSTTTFPLLIGRLTTTYFDGLIDDVRIYNRDLSAQEVSSLYRTTAPGGYGRLLRPAPSVFRIPLDVGAAFAGRNQILGGGVI